MKGLLLGISAAILLAGCAQPKLYYERTGATPAMFEQDSAECKRWANQKATMKSGTPSTFSRDIGLGSGPAATGAFEGTSEDQYYRAFNECLQNKGWKQVPKPRP